MHLWCLILSRHGNSPKVSLVQLYMSMCPYLCFYYC